MDAELYLDAFSVSTDILTSFSYSLILIHAVLKITLIFYELFEEYSYAWIPKIFAPK